MIYDKDTKLFDQLLSSKVVRSTTQQRRHYRFVVLPLCRMLSYSFTGLGQVSMYPKGTNAHYNKQSEGGKLPPSRMYHKELILLETVEITRNDNPTCVKEYDT